jgi:hypothetical protein
MPQFEHLQSSVVQPMANGLVKVTNLDTAIYIYMRSLQDTTLGVKVEDAYKVGPARHDVIFSDTRGIIRTLEVEFANSPCANFANAQRSLKHLIRRFDPNARSGYRRS